jgi:serine/threonine protein kinase
MDAKIPDDVTQGHDLHAAQLPRGSTIGRYLVIALIGKGGMGEVYAAYDPELNRKVAIKLFRAQRAEGADPSEGRARLLREAQAIARLSDPHVVVIYDVGTFDDRVFLAMEFIDGYTLGYWLHAAPRTWREIVATFVAGGRGLASAHRAGIVHRDFKPENVMMTHDGKIRVMDFGLARTIEQDGVARDLSTTASLRPRPGAAPQFSSDANQDQLSTRDLSPRQLTGALPIESSLTMTGALIGTPAYMAPEQFTGDTIDARTDQFSFCVALYEALYGTRPFAGDSLPALTANVTAGRVRPPPASARVPGWLRRVLLRGLRADRTQRYPSMEALLAALSHDPARTSRNWTALVAVAALLVAAGIGLNRGER